MLLTLVSATPFEIKPTLDYLEQNAQKKAENLFVLDQLQIRILITGVGLTLTALQMGLYLAKERPDLVINAGVAGAINQDLNLGDVVQVISEQFGDLGAEDIDGSFLDIHSMGLIAPNDTPFKEGVLHDTEGDKFSFLPKVKGVSVNKVHGHEKSIESFKKQYPVDIETMEGAAFFLACLQTSSSFLAIRSISNYVEPRNRDGWKLGLAIDQLNQVLLKIFNNFLFKN